MFYAIKVDILEGKSDVSAATSHPLLGFVFLLTKAAKGLSSLSFRGYAPFKGRHRWLRYTYFRKKLQ